MKAVQIRPRPHLTHQIFFREPPDLRAIAVGLGHRAMRAQRDQHRDVAIRHAGLVQLVQQDGQNQALGRGARPVVDQDDGVRAVPGDQLGKRRGADGGPDGRPHRLRQIAHGRHAPGAHDPRQVRGRDAQRLGFVSVVATSLSLPKIPFRALMG